MSHLRRVHLAPPTMSALPNTDAGACVADQLTRAMEAVGVRAAFGITGGAIGTLFDRLNESPLIDVYHGQHEGTAAYAEGVPLMVITGNASSQLRGRGALQDSHSEALDIVRMFESITVKNRCVLSAEEACSTFFEFAQTALEERRPVHINLPLDVSNLPLASLPPRPAPRLAAPMSVNDTTWLERFLKAKRPLIFAGNGVKLSGFSGLLRDVAMQHCLPVLSTTHGRGCIAEDSSCFFGTFGFASDGSGSGFLRRHEPDAILFVGTSLGEMATAGWSSELGQAELRLQVDIDKSKFQRSYAMHGTIERDLGEVLMFLKEQRPLRRALPKVPRTSMVLRKHPKPAPEGRVHPGRLFQSLSGWMRPGGALFVEMGSAMAWAFRGVTLHGEQQLYAPLGLAAMGSGLGAAMGAATYWKDRDVLCVSGDCATLMNGSELKTAAEYDIPLKLIVLNDGGHGMVHHGSRLIGLRHTDVRFRRPVDFVGYAQALGVEALSVRTMRQWDELAPERIWAHRGPLVIDVWIDETVVPPIGDRAKVVEHASRQVAS